MASCHALDKGPIRERDSDAAKHLEYNGTVSPCVEKKGNPGISPLKKKKKTYLVHARIETNEPAYRHIDEGRRYCSNTHN